MEENILYTAKQQAANNKSDAIELIWPTAVNVSHQDGRTAWTEQKHNTYLNNLEVSFVEQLQQLKNSSARCPDENQTDKFTVLRNGCWKNINYGREEQVYRSSADSSNPLESPWINRLRRAAKGPDPSAENKELLMLRAEKKKGKESISHGLPNQFAANDSENEGSGQNFLNAGNMNTTNFESRAKRAKRLKIVSPDSSRNDQIVPDNLNRSPYPPP